MNDIQVFNNNLFGQVRVVLHDNKPYFIGLDVAEALGYLNTRDAIRTHVEPEDKADVVIHDGRQSRHAIGINESGLYALIFGSKLGKAKEFKRWVTSEVLPQIRKTGGYIPISNQDDEITIMAKAHQILERTLQEKENIIIEKSKALQIAQPKADKYDKLMNANGYLSFNVVAKQLGTGRNRLMKFLRENNILFRDGLSNIAYQTYCERGYFVVKYSTGKNGYACGVTKVTPKGLEFLHDMLEDNKIA